MVKVQCVQILQDTQSYTMRLTCVFFSLNIHENYFFVKYNYCFQRRNWPWCEQALNNRSVSEVWRRFPPITNHDLEQQKKKKLEADAHPAAHCLLFAMMLVAVSLVRCSATACLPDAVTSWRVLLVASWQPEQRLTSDWCSAWRDWMDFHVLEYFHFSPLFPK